MYALIDSLLLQAVAFRHRNVASALARRVGERGGEGGGELSLGHLSFCQLQIKRANSSRVGG